MTNVLRGDDYMFFKDDKKKGTKEQSQHSEEEKLPEAQEPQPQEQTSFQEPDYKDLFLRANADLQNFKRRIERERGEWMTCAQVDLLGKLLPLIDDFERAVQVAEEKAPMDAAAWVEGFILIQKNLKKMLADMGVEEIPAVGAFNPEFHEALMTVENANVPSGHIVQLLSKGYSFKDKVIRHARVSVAK